MIRHIPQANRNINDDHSQIGDMIDNAKDIKITVKNKEDLVKEQEIPALS